MFGSAMLLIPVLLCGILGATIGYLYRYRVLPRRFLTVLGAIIVFLLFEITTGALSSKYSLRENLLSQADALAPFIFLYLLPAILGSFFVARRFRTWSE